MNGVPLHVVQWAAEECARQFTSPIGVYHMLNAWAYAKVSSDLGAPILFDIRTLGRFVDPDTNREGFRAGPAVFIDGGKGSEASTIPDRLIRLLDLTRGSAPITPEEFYQEFEFIHPFKDGNGRVGSILFNWLNGTLDNPLVPPRFRY